MEFGSVRQGDLDGIDFALPADPSFNKEVLVGSRSERLRVWVGCAKWGRSEWVGKIYPLRTRERDFLGHYVQQFNSLELNATHYKIFGAAAIARWASKAAGREFLFCPKMFQGVTHRGKLKNNRFVLNEFLRGVAAFGDHLGPILVQVSDNFSPRRKEELLSFLRTLPPGRQFFLEVRHHGWYAPRVRDEFFPALRDLHIGAVITDAAGRRDCVHMFLTLPKVFVRFVGNSLHPTDYKRIDDWVTRVHAWIERGVEEVYFFMHMHDEAMSPELAAYFIERLNSACGLQLKVPKFMMPGKSA